MAKDINKRIAAEVSWARTHDRSARTRPAREAFLKRFEKEVDPDGTLPPEDRRQRAEHAKRAYMLQLAKRSAAARKASSPRQRADWRRPIGSRRDSAAQSDHRC
jgi:hypothetical protein